MNYRELVVWQRSMELAELVFQYTARFPSEQRYVLCSQMQRAALSVPANVAEGHGRKSTGAFLNHLSIAKGSLLELETIVELAARLGHLSEADAGRTLSLSDEVGRMLAGLKASLDRTV